MLKKKNKKIVGEEKEEKIMDLDSVDEPKVVDDAAVDEASDFEEEGQLSVDVYQDKDNIYIKSTIAGVDPNDLDITFDNDMITIRGKRQQDKTIRQEDYFYQECYWGSFSRSIILPVDVDEDRIEATVRNGILTVVLPKAKRRGIDIKMEDDE